MAGRKKFRWYRFRWAQVILFLLFRIIVTAVGFFPYRAAPRLGRILGTLIRWGDVRQRTYAAEHLALTKFTDDIPGMVQGMYAHFGLMSVELLMLPRLLRGKEMSRYVSLERFEVFDDGLKRGKGVIAAIAHLGNWELAGLAATLAGYPLHSLARPLDNPYVEQWMRRFRTSTGQRIISKFGALRSMVAVLKRNEILVIQADHDAKLSGVPVQFLGRTAMAFRSPAVLALKYGAPVVPTNIYRDAHGYHRIVLDDPLFPAEFENRPDPVQALTQALTSRFEAFVREHPDQWTWSHRRWRTVDRSKYARELAAMGIKASS